jgi:hypothetical protein
VSLLACSGCFIGSGGSPFAYLFATVVMLIVPLTLVGGLFWVLVRGSAAEGAEEPDAVHPRGDGGHPEPLDRVAPAGPVLRDGDVPARG